MFADPAVTSSRGRAITPPAVPTSGLTTSCRSWRLPRGSSNIFAPRVRNRFSSRQDDSRRRAEFDAREPRRNHASPWDVRVGDSCRAPRENALRCRPPLEEGELARVAHSIGRYPPAAGPESADEIADVSESGTPLTVSLRDFLNEIPAAAPSLVGDGIIPRAGFAVLAGESGLGKTALAVHLSLCLASGHPFLSLDSPSPSTVLFVEAEGNRDSFRARVATAVANLGFGENLPTHFSARNSGEGFSPSDQRLTATIGRLRPALVVLDTVWAVAEGLDENSASSWREKVFAPLKNLVDRFGCSFLLIHHFSKPSELRHAVDRVRGSGALRAFADCLMTLERPRSSGKTDRLLCFLKIRGPEREPLSVTFNVQRAVFTPSDGFTFTPDARLLAIQGFVAAGIVRTGEILEAAKARFDIAKTQAESLLSKAFDAGLIRKVRKGEYRLPNDPPHPSVPPPMYIGGGEPREDARPPEILKPGKTGDSGESWWSDLLAAPLQPGCVE